MTGVDGMLVSAGMEGALTSFLLLISFLLALQMPDGWQEIKQQECKV